MDNFEQQRGKQEAAKQEKEKKAEALELDVESGELPIELDAEINGLVDDSEKALENMAHGDVAGFVKDASKYAGSTFKNSACTLIEVAAPGAVFAASMMDACMEGDKQEEEDLRRAIEDDISKSDD